MATINAVGSGNAVNRMRMSKSRTLLQYSDRRISDGAWLGAAILVSRLSLTDLKITSPFVIS